MNRSSWPRNSCAWVTTIDPDFCTSWATIAVRSVALWPVAIFWPMASMLLRAVPMLALMVAVVWLCVADLRDDSGGHSADFADAVRNSADSGDGGVGAFLYRGDVGGDFFRCLRGLCRQCFDFIRHDGKAFAGIASAGGFDGGVKGEQVRLTGDFIDERNHRADFIGRVA